MGGKLYLVGTPIGNLEDITVRALRILKEVDVILCEDTTRSLKLLNHYEIKKPLYAYYKFNERERLSFILSLLKEGKILALITSAGMPLISDPGLLLVKTLRELKIPIECIPGPSALITALSLSGFPSDRFIFEGFLPKQRGLMEKRLQEIKALPHTLVFFVPARDINKVLEGMSAILGNRRICIARELTKLHEEVIITDMATFLAENRALKGEITLIVEGEREKKTLDEIEIKKFFLEELRKGKTFKDLLKSNVLEGCPKNRLYDLWEEAKNEQRKD